jgi:hypothetical protein
MLTAGRASERFPDLMLTPLAARYCGYTSSSGLRKAYLDRRVRPCGRRGGRGAWTWAKADLDMFMRGAGINKPREPSEVVPAQNDATSPDTLNSSKREARLTPAVTEREGAQGHRRRHSPETEAALRRLKEIAKPRNPK